MELRTVTWCGDRLWQQGFMILQLWAAKAPGDAADAAVTHEPWYTPVE